jgi:hypothetical protein
MNKKNFLLAILLILSGAAHAQTQIVHDTIPFEIVQDKFIFQATIDGKPLRLILDTGGQNILVADSADHYGVEILRSQTIADVNGARIQTQVGGVKNFRIGRRMKWDFGKMTIVPNNPFFRELGVAGAVGGEAFKEVCLSIDRRNRRFTISYPYRPGNIPRSAGTPIHSNTDHAIVPVRFGSDTIDVLFDTGASGFLSLSADDFKKLNARPGNVVKQAAGSGILYVGVAGIDQALADSLYKVSIPVMTLPGGKELHNVGTLAGPHPATIAGQKLFDYGIVMLDYPRGLFYFFPYEEGASDVEAETKTWNVKILPVADRFEIVATIGPVDAAVGDRVWEIDGIDLAGVKFSETAVLELLERVEGDSTLILTGPEKKGARRVEIRKI